MFRRSCFATQKLYWSCLQQRVWVSSHRSSVSSYRLLPPETTERAFTHVRPSTLLSFRTEVFQKAQTSSALFWVTSKCFHNSSVRLKKRAKPEPPPSEQNPLHYKLRDVWEGPEPALYLGFAGLIPFVFPTLFMTVTQTYYPELAYTQLAYGASIVSFLGGARWGFALPESSPARPDWINLTNSVVPSLLACAIMLMSDNITPAVTTVIIAFGISQHYDLSLLPTYPRWFKAMRTILTGVACFSLIGMLFLKGSFTEKKLFGD